MNGNLRDISCILEPIVYHYSYTLRQYLALQIVNDEAQSVVPNRKSKRGI